MIIGRNFAVFRNQVVVMFSFCWNFVFFETLVCAFGQYLYLALVMRFFID